MTTQTGPTNRGGAGAAGTIAAALAQTLALLSASPAALGLSGREGPLDPADRSAPAVADGVAGAKCAPQFWRYWQKAHATDTN